MAEGAPNRDESVPRSFVPFEPSEATDINDSVDLTPEGIRENFFRLQELMKEYVREGRLRGVRLRLDYEDEVDTPLNVSPQSNPTNSVTLVIPPSTTEAQALLAGITSFSAAPPQSSISAPIGTTVYPFTTKERERKERERKGEKTKGDPDGVPPQKEILM
ncbi:hypothetical protein R6Q57_029941 [Mikania cordata]